MLGVMSMATSFKRTYGSMLWLPELLHSVPLTLRQATVNPRLHWRLLDTSGHVWVSLLWGHCSFLLGPGAHKVLFVPQESVSPFLCKFWKLYGGVNGNLLSEELCHMSHLPDLL